jgi:hypothetical protein
MPISSEKANNERAENGLICVYDFTGMEFLMPGWRPNRKLERPDL